MSVYFEKGISKELPVRFRVYIYMMSSSLSSLHLFGQRALLAL